MAYERFINPVEGLNVIAGDHAEPRVGAGHLSVDASFAGSAYASQYEISCVIEDQRREGSSDGLWGYYPRYPDQSIVASVGLPKTHVLGETVLAAVRTQLVSPELELDFIRLSEKRHISPGLHTDADARGAVHGDVEKGERDVLKVIANLHETEPREFRYLNTSLQELATLGLKWDRDVYTGVDYDDIPNDLLETYYLPPRTEDEIHYLAFLANSIPHSGIDGSGGHFLVGLATYV